MRETREENENLSFMGEATSQHVGVCVLEQREGFQVYSMIALVLRSDRVEATLVLGGLWAKAASPPPVVLCLMLFFWSVRL